MKLNHPVPVENAADIANFFPGIFAVAISALYPELAVVAGMTQVAVNLVRDRFQKQQAILAAELKASNLSTFTDEQQAAFVPMVFQYFEKARQGEYEHTLEVLAAFITGEMKKEMPEPGNVARMARRIEGLSKRDLQMIALINDFSNRPLPNPPFPPNDGSITIFNLVNAFPEAATLGGALVRESLAELESRALLVVTNLQIIGGNSETFSTTEPFHDLIENAQSKFARPQAQSV